LEQSLSSLDPERIRSNLDLTRERIAAAAARAGRDPDEVELVVATKYVPVEQMGALADAGITLVGENIPRDLAKKHVRWGKCFTFDFIGHLQSRRTKDVLPYVRLIHSVESESVLRRLEHHADEHVRVLIEVNVAGEASKYGLDPDAVNDFVEKASLYPKVTFGGLMTMPPLVRAPDEARPYFAALRELGETLRRDWGSRHDFTALSMGTSQDYEVAVEEGATVVRLGSVLYA
jgi:pyridoxal phosphate enzyme (YggS family)